MSDSSQDSDDDQATGDHSLLLKPFFESKELADCFFVFIKQEDVSQRGRKRKNTEESRIPAHKFVLAAHSPVFRAMFYGPLAEKDDEIVITDITPKVFESMLRYVYTGEEISNDLSDIYQLFMAANKYDFDKLMIKIEDKLIENLSIANVLETYEFMERFHKPNELFRISFFIQKHAMLILEHATFTQIQRSTLKFIFVALQTFGNAVEIQLFHACLRWSKAECERNSIANPTLSQLRETLGDELYLIRIPTMTVNQFVEGPMASGLLNTTEQKELLNFILTVPKPEPEGEFLLRFKSYARKRASNSCITFINHFKRIKVNFLVKDAVTILQFKSSADFLLNGFSFGHVTVPFSITCVQLLENSSQIFFQQKMSCKQIKEIAEEESSLYEIEFPSSLLISANRTYRLNLNLELNDFQNIRREIVREKFIVKLKRNFQDVPIAIEMENITRSGLRIYQFWAY